MNGKYQRLKKIGSGSFGEVYEVRHIGTGQQFAIKRILISRDTQSAADNEIKSLSKMNHPNILRINEYYYEEDQQGESYLCMVLEFCRNEDLLAHFAKNRKSFVSVEKEAVLIFRQIVSGCMALHEKGIIHRDLKPENVLLNGNVVKIADFGCAKILQKHLKSPKLTYNIGTPIYSAPEVFNQQNYDQRCDIWSAGVILYFMIYGTVPFLQKNIQKLRVIIESKTRDSELDLPNFPEISPETSKILKGMLKYNQQQRLVWGEIMHSRIFHSRMSDVQGYISYLLEINKVLAWLLQSLISFSEYYSAPRLSRLVVLYNRFMHSNMTFALEILQKGPYAQTFFKQGKLNAHHFSKEILKSVDNANNKMNHYLQVMNNKFKDASGTKNTQSGRYNLWYAQEQARIISANTKTTKQSPNFRRSLYCLLVLAGFDRFLGQQHYLSLDSHQFIQAIKQMPPLELDNRISREMERII